MNIQVRVLWTQANGDVEERIVHLHRDCVIVGEKGADIGLAGESVSIAHAMFYQGLRGELRVMDLKSRTGTYLGERRILDSAVGPGSVVRIGRFALLVESYAPSRMTLEDTMAIDRDEKTVAAEIR